MWHPYLIYWYILYIGYYKSVNSIFHSHPVVVDDPRIRLILFYRRNYHALYITQYRLLLIYHANVLFWRNWLDVLKLTLLNMMTDMLPNNTLADSRVKGIRYFKMIRYNIISLESVKYPICIKILLNHGIINATHRKSSDTV